ncbi:MAG: type IV pilus twitching motility protein PilT [Candidatus Pacebacteria bacterium]|jgi:twitching motility protein PilT|nr:type IV pilus twitching motility protein PilT [Candidatus Paceibacterota bacterium]MBT3511936.1 type IV pilus twitching motility protein PilT [Candidatus Paceibacterota bacterium]MBT4005258.1 type IV pilus twitching motility protein PilT [Candidatus Paceibacterota bacterium]MBT4358978.1 type IV pilus twitching motility protein PilT [Candidatus Paceibacterota bacterium]MBT4680457.1 type IV pilus twitching motility protein PilT [Candidatus Paceibacterota bacterium]
MNIYDMLKILVDRQGSDLHIIAGAQPTFRVNGNLEAIENTPRLTPEQTVALINPLLNNEQRDYVELHKEIDFGYQFGDDGRFRVNVYHANGALAAALRLIPRKIRSIDELKLPDILHQFTAYKQGLVLVTGPTGEGKSTTLAAIIDEINQQRSEHILTIEDPIEFVLESKRSIVSQREMNQDTQDWGLALRSAMREDPDVVLVGEIRDYETIASAITVAETGHLVFTTLHTNTASQTMDRMIDVFPSNQQGQIRQQLAGSIKAVVSQRLVPTIDGAQTVVAEVLIANSAIKNLIRESKTHLMENVIQTSSADGMILMENSLVDKVRQGVVSKEVARDFSFRPDIFDQLMEGR